jgi:hypothetical protein
MMKAGAEVCLRPQERRAFFCCGALGAIGTSRRFGVRAFGQRVTLLRAVRGGAGAADR